MNADDLIYWVNEREAIRMRKSILEDAQASGSHIVLSEAGRKVWGNPEEPWRLDYLTNDPILRAYRFCCPRREDDRVTRWIREHIIVPYWDHPNLWLMLCIARTINWPPALQEIMKGRTSWPWFEDFQPAKLGEALQVIKDRGDKLYTGAYMIRAESHPEVEWFSWPKQRYIAEIVIGRLWDDPDRKDIWTYVTERDFSVGAQSVWEYFCRFLGWGPFMAGQVVTDLKHTRYLQNCPDFDTWTALGPGSRRGLNRLHGRNVAGALSQEQGLSEMIELKAALDEPGVIWPWLQPMELSDVQNCLCEYDKWCRVRLNQGKPRARYVPGRGY